MKISSTHVRGTGTRTGLRPIAEGEAGVLRRPHPNTQEHSICLRIRFNQNNKEHPPTHTIRLTSSEE